MSQLNRRSWFHGLAAALVIASVAASCSSDDTGAGTSPSISTASSASAAADASAAPAVTGGEAPAGTFPRVVTTALGDVTIPAGPTRVVTLGNVDSDIVVGLGVTPVAMMANSSFESGISPWLEAALGAGSGDVDQLDGTNGAPLEAIAAAKPDLIVAGSASFDLAAVYDQLSAIAPVVGYIDEPFTDTWQDRTRLVGTALGRDDQAAAAIDTLETDLAARTAAHPEWAGDTFVFGIHFDGTTRVITSPTDSTLMLFTQTFGLAVPSAVEALGDQLNGTADIGLEQLDLLDADVVLLAFFSPDDEATLSTNPLFQALPAVTDANFRALDLATATALREASILAIPYAADTLETALSATLDS